MEMLNRSFAGLPTSLVPISEPEKNDQRGILVGEEIEVPLVEVKTSFCSAEDAACARATETSHKLSPILSRVKHSPFLCSHVLLSSPGVVVLSFFSNLTLGLTSSGGLLKINQDGASFA